MNPLADIIIWKIRDDNISMDLTKSQNSEVKHTISSWDQQISFSVIVLNTIQLEVSINIPDITEKTVGLVELKITNTVIKSESRKYSFSISAACPENDPCCKGNCKEGEGECIDDLACADGYKCGSSNECTVKYTGNFENVQQS